MFNRRSPNTEKNSSSSSPARQRLLVGAVSLAAAFSGGETLLAPSEPHQEPAPLTGRVLSGGVNSLPQDLPKNAEGNPIIVPTLSRDLYPIDEQRDDAGLPPPASTMAPGQVYGGNHVLASPAVEKGLLNPPDVTG